MMIINPLGEVFLDDNCIIGSINIHDLAVKLGKKDVSKKDINAEFDSQAREYLNDQQYNLYKFVSKLQDLNNSRFRIYCTSSKNFLPVIKMVTEFMNFVDQKEYWKELKKAVKKWGANLTELYEDKHMDHSILNYGTPEEKHVYGENHGRMERQVEVWWDITTLTKKEVKGLMDKMADATQGYWDATGVNIL